MATTTGRLDRIIADLERLQKDGHDILNSYVDQLLCQHPRGTSFGATKYREFADKAGETLNLVEALKQLRERLTNRVTRY
jgi:hypothetical protein